ncbi:MAG: ASCH domain-containing protein [Tetrasphaera sp.]
MPSQGLWANEVAILDAATALAGRLGWSDDHTVAAAAIDLQGRVHTGVNVYHFTGGPCAELVVLGAAATAGAGPLAEIVAVGDGGRGILAPCGRCRQVLLDQHPDILVLMPGEEPAPVGIAQLLPDGYRQPDTQPVGRFVRFRDDYHDPILTERKTVTIRHDDPVPLGPVTFVFERPDRVGYRLLQANVDAVEPRRLDALTDADVRGENANSLAEVLAGVRQHYPGLAPDAIVDVVRFHVTH